MSKEIKMFKKTTVNIITLKTQGHKISC